MTAEEYETIIKYNREHLPSAEFPPFVCDWQAINEFIKTTGFRIHNDSEKFLWYKDYCSMEKSYISKSDFDNDTLKAIELIHNDFEWFCNNPIGHGVVEEIRLLEDFLRKKYPMLSEKSVSEITNTYGYYNK